MTRRLAALAIVAALLAACGPTAAQDPIPVPSAPAVDQTRATEIAASTLRAYNDGDYAGWTADWSASMKGAIDESAFATIRSQLLERYGRYVSLGTPAPSKKTSTTYRWTFPVTFEKGGAAYWFAFEDGGTEIVGVKFE